jgi:type IV pilus assembly protein PilM
MPSLNQPIKLSMPKLPSGMPSLSLRRPGRPTRNLVGLDIEPGQVVAAQVEVNGVLRVERAAGLPIPPNVVRDGEVTDVESLAGALRELFGQAKLDRRVRIGIANQRIVVRKIELPPIEDRRELETAVRFQAQEQIPMPIDSAVIDFHALGIVDTPEGPRQQIVLVAARRDMVDRVLAAARAAGLRPEGVDLSAFAMVRALRPAGADANERVLYLAIGGLTNLAVAEGSTCQFTRVIGGGIEQIVADVAERCAVPLAQARQLLAQTGDPEHLVVEPQAPAAPLAELGNLVSLYEDETPGGGDLPSPAMPHADLGATAMDAPSPMAAPAAQNYYEQAPPGHDPAPAMQDPAAPPSDPAAVARGVLEDGTRRIAAEVRNSLDFHRSQEHGEPVTRAVLCGPAVDVPGFADAIAAELNIPVTVGGVETGPGVAGVPASRLTVAAGLALERGLA